jgi:hypothetical protein
MTCRVARSYQHFDHGEPVTCSECGSTHMDVRVTSSTLGPHLCSICAQSSIPRVASSVHELRVPMRYRLVA